jgi:hypothetical protein
MRGTDVNKLLKAGYRFIRGDRHSNSIRIQCQGTYSHGWKILEKGFKTYNEVEKRINELLEDEKTLEL